MDELVLREKAREVIRAGVIPSRHPERTWGGPGVGAHCTICRVPVQRDELEIELEFVRQNEASDPDRYHVHIRCFAAWDVERESACGESL
jgi:hypothetical protein